VGERAIASALSQIESGDEREAAVTLARKKLRLTESLAPEVRRRRTLALLGRKGYSASVAAQAYEQALSEL